MSLVLPRENDIKANKILINDCLYLFGDEIGALIDSEMSALEGEDWLMKLGRFRNKYNINFRDPDFVLKEPLKSDSPLRKILPKSKTFYDNLSVLSKVRNKTFHNAIDGELAQVKVIVNLFFEVANDLGNQYLCNEFASAIKRLGEIERGVIFENEPLTEGRITDLENKSAELEEKLNEARTNSIKLENLLEEKNKEIIIREIEIEQVKNSSEKRTQAIELSRLNLEEANEESEKLKTSLEISDKLVEDLKLRESKLKNIVGSLAESILDDKKLSILRDGLSKATLKEELNSDASPELHTIGSYWYEEKGKRKLTLSVARRDIVDPRTNEPLNSIPVGIRSELAESWLTIRPSGGRIFIDEDGNAVTLQGEKLVFLGNIAKYL